MTWRRHSLLAMLMLVCALGTALLSGQALAQTAAPAAAASQVIAEAASGAVREMVPNPYGLQAMWQAGGLVTRGTLLVLLLMSVASWYVIVVKVAEQSALMRQAGGLPAGFWSAGNPQEALDQLPQGTVFQRVARAAIEAKQEHVGELTRNVDLNSWVAGSIQNALDEVQSHLQGGLTLLATVGATSPFVGLFGTVWGIYQALIAIGIAGQASIDKVAGPVGESLIMTALGLAVAIPAVLGYNWLGRRNRLVLGRVRAFGSELHARLLGRAARTGEAQQ